MTTQSLQQEASPLGILAGEGIFPLLVARGARAVGRKVVVCAFRGSAWSELREEVDVFRWVGVLRPGQWIREFKSEGCRQVIMVGRVAKEKMYSRWRWFQYIPDVRAFKVWFTQLRTDKRDQAVLRAIDRELSSEGIDLIDSTTYCKEHLAGAGIMTRREPSPKQWEDIRFGWDLCQTISRLDIGQSMAVVDKNVIAVEAVEGTNAMIERAGQLCRVGGWTLIKVSNVRRDMRLDVPTVGVATIEKLHAAGATALVLEPGKTIMLEKPKILELAERYRIAIVGYEPEVSPESRINLLCRVRTADRKCSLVRSADPTLNSGVVMTQPAATKPQSQSHQQPGGGNSPAAISRQFVNFAFYKLDPAFRRLDSAEKEQARTEFAGMLKTPRPGLICLSYSTVGLRGDVDLLLWRISMSVDDFQAQTQAIHRTRLGGYLTTPWSFVSMTKRSMYIDKVDPFHTAESRTHIIPGKRKFLFVYPFVKTREWYLLPLERRQELMDGHIRIGNKYQSVKLNTTYSFGLDDQDFVVAFETDEPKDFLDLVMELRETESSKYTARDTPIFTCVQADPEKILEQLF